MSEYESIYNNSTSINFNQKFSTIITNIDLTNFDENLFKNINENDNILNTNLFTKLHSIFNEEQDRIFNLFETKNEFNSIAEKISIDMNNVNINYDPDNLLKELQVENKEKDLLIENSIEKQFNFNINDLIKNIDTFKAYYKELFIETMNLENDIEIILKKYDKTYNSVKDIYQKLSELSELDNINNTHNKNNTDNTDNTNDTNYVKNTNEHIHKIDFEINNYIKNYFEKENLIKKLEIYKNNIEKLKYLKVKINKINSISYSPFCNICMTHIVDTVIIPCGHTCCSGCIQQLNNKCFICRKEYKDLKKIYIN